MFAVITPALIAGAFVERVHFRGYLVFIGLCSLLAYCPSLGLGRRIPRRRRAACHRLRRRVGGA